VTVDINVSDGDSNVTPIFVADSGKPANGESPHKKLSTTESMHEKLKLPLADNIEK
jgi:hypothetical protein